MCIRDSHKDGRLQVLCRTRNAQIATSWSSDNGETWSKVTLLDVPNNNSGTDCLLYTSNKEAKLNKVELKKTYLYDLETKAGEEYIFLGK